MISDCWNIVAVWYSSGSLSNANPIIFEEAALGPPPPLPVVVDELVEVLPKLAPPPPRRRVDPASKPE